MTTQTLTICVGIINNDAYNLVRFSILYARPFTWSTGYTQRLKQFFTGEKRPSVDLKGELKKLIFTTSGDPLVACENAGTFTMVMSTFTQYEKHVSTASSGGGSGEEWGGG